MSIVQPTTDPIRQTKDFDTTPSPSFGGGLAWSPGRDAVRATVVEAAVSKYDLCVFDLPINAADSTTTRDVGTFDRQHPFNFVRPHDVQMAAAKAAATGTVTFTGVPTDGNSFIIPDGHNTYVFFFDDDADVSVTEFVRRVVFDAGDTATQVQVAFRDAVNASTIKITASGAATVTTLTHDEVGAHGNQTIVDSTDNATDTDMTGGVNAPDLPIYCVACHDAAVGERVRVVIAGLARVSAAAGVAYGDFLTATTAAATVTTLAAFTFPVLVIGRALEDRHTEVDTTLDQHNTVLCTFNGLRGLGVNNVAH